MGANFSLIAPTAPSIAVSAYVDVLDQIQYLEQLGTSRFLKTVHALDSDGAIVVKVFMKQNEEMDLSHWQQVLNEQRIKLMNIPSVLPYSKVIETDRAGYLIRQYLKTNIYDRISTRPFLEDVEKKWLVFQLLNAINDCHEQDVAHGDIKTENILVTSWNWILLSDFAPFKPVYLPEDNPGNFSFYFDTSQRRSCYLAPERFVSANAYDDQMNENARVHPKMDIFSLGCVIAEIFLEGSPTFTLSELYKYKKGEFEPDLSGIQDESIRALVESMINLDPDQRLSAKEYLIQFRGSAFDDNFYSFIYEYFKSFNEDIVSLKLSERRNEFDTRINRLYNDFDKISYFLGFEYTHLAQNPDKSEPNFIPMSLALPGIPANYTLKATSKLPSGTKDATLIFLSFTFSSIRNVTSEHSKIQALELILGLSEFVHDEGKLDRSLPYVISLLHDTSVNIQSTALKVMTQLLLQVDAIGPVNVSLFPEFIIPRLTKLLNNASSYTKMTFASCLPYLAITSLRFHEMSIILKKNVLENSVDPETENGVLNPSGLFEGSKQGLIEDFETFTIAMLTDSDSNVKIALLRNILSLCSFFGKEKTNDLILSHLITYLNDKNPLLRVEFVESVVGLSIYVGVMSLEHYILPLLVQTLTDPEELVVIKVLHMLPDLCKLGLIRPLYIWDLLSSVSKLLLHPNEWIRQSTISLIVVVAERLPLADLYCMLYPIIRPYIEYEVTDFSWRTLYSVVKRPISRPVYNLACTWSLRAEKTLFWQPVQGSHTDAFGNKGLEFMSKPVLKISSDADNANGILSPSNSIMLGNVEIPLSSEDRNWAERLLSSGLNEQELWKIEDFREYIYRVSRLMARINTKAHEKGMVHIQELEVLPKNVFFDTKFRSEIFTNHNVSNEDNSTANLSLDDRLYSNLFITDSFSNSIAPVVDDDRTLIATDTNISQLNDNEPSSSLILGKSKAAPSTTTNEENAYGELESSFQHRSHTVKAKDSKISNTDIVSSVVTNSYTGKDPYILKFLQSVKIEPSLEQFRDFDHPIDKNDLLFSKNWNPKGELVSHLKEHKSSVNCIAVSPDHTYFVTGDNDGSLKIWDTSKIEKNVSSSSDLSIELDNAITKIQFLPDYHTFGVATKDGQIRIIKTKSQKHKKSSTTSRSSLSGITIIREYKLSDQYAIDLCFGYKEYRHLLYIVTSASQIICFDIRDMNIEFTLDNKPSDGIITTFTIDTTNCWLLTGSLKGVLTLWDLRFRLRLRTWKFKKQYPVTKVVACSNDYHLNRKKGRFAIVTGGTGDSDITIWDVSTGTCRETFSRSSTDGNFDKYSLIEIPDNNNSTVSNVSEKLADDFALLDLNNENKNYSMTAFCSIEKHIDHRRHFCILGATYSYDIILWNVYHPEHSKIVLNNASDSNHTTPQSKAAFSSSQINPNMRIITEKYSTESDTNEPNSYVRGGSKKKRKSKSSLISQEQDEIIKRHHDTITDIAIVLSPYEMIISVDRSGAINIYK